MKNRATYLLGTPVLVTNVLALLEQLKDLFDKSLLLLQLFHFKRLTATAGLLDKVLVSLLDELDILDTELLTDNLKITNRVDVTLDVDDLGIIETSYDLKDGIDGTNVRQESVTETGTSGGTTGQTSNVVDGLVGRNLRLRLVLLAQPVESLIGNNNARLLRVDGGVREVLKHVSVMTLKLGAARRTAGLPSEHFVIAWKRVDFPTLARPTCD